MSKGTASGDLVGDVPVVVGARQEEEQVVGNEADCLRGVHEP